MATEVVVLRPGESAVASRSPARVTAPRHCATSRAPRRRRRATCTAIATRGAGALADPAQHHAEQRRSPPSRTTSTGRGAPRTAATSAPARACGWSAPRIVISSPTPALRPSSSAPARAEPAGDHLVHALIVLPQVGEVARAASQSAPALSASSADRRPASTMREMCDGVTAASPSRSSVCAQVAADQEARPPPSASSM